MAGDLRYGLYLTTGHDSDGRLWAICSDGSPQRGHPIETVSVLTLELVDDEDAAVAWFSEVRKTRPWEATP